MHNSNSCTLDLQALLKYMVLYLSDWNSWQLQMNILKDPVIDGGDVFSCHWHKIDKLCFAEQRLKEALGALEIHMRTESRYGLKYATKVQYSQMVSFRVSSFQNAARSVAAVLLSMNMLRCRGKSSSNWAQINLWGSPVFQGDAVANIGRPCWIIWTHFWRKQEQKNKRTHRMDTMERKEGELLYCMYR